PAAGAHGHVAVAVAVAVKVNDHVNDKRQRRIEGAVRLIGAIAPTQCPVHRFLDSNGTLPAMKLTPLDLQQKTFRKVRFGGLDTAEVHAFLELVGAQLEELHRKAQQQDEELRRREARMAEYAGREQLLQQTLTTAQRLGEEMKGQSRKEA